MTLYGNFLLFRILLLDENFTSGFNFLNFNQDFDLLEDDDHNVPFDLQILRF